MGYYRDVGDVAAKADVSASVEGWDEGEGMDWGGVIQIKLLFLYSHSIAV